MGELEPWMNADFGEGHGGGNRRWGFFERKGTKVAKRGGSEMMRILGAGQKGERGCLVGV
jgi:hypothetical protein